MHEPAGDMRDIGGGAAHVETDHPLEPVRPADMGHADDAAGRTRQDRVAAAEGGRCRKSAVRLHEEDGGGRERPLERAHMGQEGRRESGIGDRRVTARHETHQRRDLVACRDLGKAHLARQRGKRLLVRRVAPGVHQEDRHRLEPVGQGLRKRIAHRGGIERAHHRPIRADAFVHFQHALRQLLPNFDVKREDVGAGLVADGQGVGKATGHHQQRARALALEERVGGDRRAHLHDKRAIMVARQRADGSDSGILGIDRAAAQELQRLDAAIGKAGDGVGEGAAAVDPDLERARWVHRVCVPRAPARVIPPAHAGRAASQAVTAARADGRFPPCLLSARAPCRVRSCSHCWPRGRWPSSRSGSAMR
jgi:hypothetical protein